MFSRRILYLMLGHACMALAAAGAFLPLLPTVPFIIAASACYARSSERLHSALHAHRWTGPILRDWEEKRAISRRAKKIAVCTVMGGIGFSCFLVPLPAVRLVLIAIGIAVCGFILTRPTSR